MLVALATACGSTPPRRSAPPAPAMLALVGGRVQAHPETAAIDDAIVLMAGDTITAVGRT